MNKALQDQYRELTASSSQLHFVVTQFLLQATSCADAIADYFVHKKGELENRPGQNLLPQAEEYHLIAYKDSVVQRFIRCYKNTRQYLKLYLWELHGVACENPEEIFQQSLRYDLISSQEAALLLQLSTEFGHGADMSDLEVSDEIIQYCVMMCSIVQRFDKKCLSDI